MQLILECLIGPDIDSVLQRPAASAINCKKRPAQVRPVHHLNDRAIIQNRRRRRHDPLLFLLIVGFHPLSLREPLLAPKERNYATPKGLLPNVECGR